MKRGASVKFAPHPARICRFDRYAPSRKISKHPGAPSLDRRRLDRQVLKNGATTAGRWPSGRASRAGRSVDHGSRQKNPSHWTSTLFTRWVKTASGCARRHGSPRQPAQSITVTANVAGQPARVTVLDVTDEDNPAVLTAQDGEGTGPGARGRVLQADPRQRYAWVDADFAVRDTLVAAVISAACGDFGVQLDRGGGQRAKDQLWRWRTTNSPRCRRWCSSTQKTPMSATVAGLADYGGVMKGV
jgi:hypothetical protein